MADVPRDPRQLARDILAGKISIEELAREQRRRTGAQQPPAQPQQRVPLPAPLPPPQQRPVVRQAPPPRKPQQQQQRPRPAPAPRPAPRPAAAPPPVAAPRRQQPVAVPESTPTASAHGPSQSQTAGNRAKPRAKEALLGIRRLAGSRDALRQGIIMSEILGKPVALRDEP